MILQNQSASVYIPDGTPQEKALSRTTDLCIAAHQDDIEIMAYGPAAACYGKPDRWFTGVVVTDGAGSPRTGLYAAYTDEEMKAVRIKEQEKAAAVGDYAAQVFLSYASGEVKDPQFPQTAADIASVIRACHPETIYTHNLADKHDTHVAVVLRTLAAIRSLAPEERPKKLYAMEVWRGLDWLCDEDKACFDTSTHPNLAAALLGVFDSQIAGGKRYDLAAVGRRLANATFFESHQTDACDSLSYGLDITPLIDGDMGETAFISSYIRRFQDEVETRIAKLL